MILKMDTGYSNDDSETWEDFFGSSVEIKGSILKLCNIPTPARKPFKNLNVLSPNVQRILAHSDCISDPPSPTENQSQFMIKSKLPVRKAKSHHNFPLSGVVSKISQSSNDLQIHTESHTDNLEDTTSVKSHLFTLHQNMADNDMESISETTSVADISLTSTISDCSNSQNIHPFADKSQIQQAYALLDLYQLVLLIQAVVSTSTNNNRGGSQYLASIESLADHSDQDRMYENRSTLSVGEKFV
ncbi:uncharacterized protein LOC113390613 [Ctenocephalides felis]|uniref:uncharacterized protein LOC113390613 n=1 Tax=Ctenocephalides felis TaxID=7515 RepID=UPI000E6E523B|nr:uncharacterized protein LOC113390613 [Ctenocephalides felis]